MASNLPVIPPTLPSGYCFESWQKVANDLVGGGLVQFAGSGFTVIINSNSTPSSEDRDKLWWKPDDSRLYYWNASIGKWVNKHPIQAGSNERRIFIGTLAQIELHDGGESGSVGDASGPMWEVDSDFAARMPLGVGTLPDTSTPVVAGDTGGAETHTLTVAQLPAHSHDYQAIEQSSTDPRPWSTGGNDGKDVDRVTEETGGGEAHNNMPPYIGVYFIKRSARIFYRGN